VAGVDDLQRILTEGKVNVATDLHLLRGTEKLRFEVTPREATSAPKR